LASALLAGAQARGVALAEPADFRSLTGRGVTATVGRRRLALGNQALPDAPEIDAPALREGAGALRRSGRTVMLLAADGALAGLVAVDDPIKAGAGDALARLRADGLRVVMATGDSGTTASAVARELGLADVAAEVRPEQKAELVAKLQAQGGRGAMAGDGGNDGPALARREAG